MKNIISGISKCICGAGLIGAALLIWSHYDQVNMYLDGLKPAEYKTYDKTENVSKKSDTVDGALIIDAEEILDGSADGKLDNSLDKSYDYDAGNTDSGDSNSNGDAYHRREAEESNSSLIDGSDNLIVDSGNNTNNSSNNNNNASKEDSNLIEDYDRVTDISPSGSWAEAAELVKPAICRIKVGNYWGSGIIWHIEDNHVYVMANKHILDKSNIGYVAFYNGMNAAGTVKSISAQFDIGILDIDISRWSNYEKKNIKEVNISQGCAANLTEGMQIFMLGSADGVASNISNGTIGDPWYYYEYMDATYIYTHCKAKPGMSGGGCFDCHGHLLGIISGGNEGTEETLCIPVQMLLEMGYR